MPEEFKNSKNNNHSHVGFVLKKTRVAIPMIIFEVIAFKKLPFKMFSVHTKTKSLRFQRYRKVLFLWRISVDGMPNRTNKAAQFSWRISVDGMPNRTNSCAVSCRISVDGMPNRTNKAAPFSWRISVDGVPDRTN